MPEELEQMEVRRNHILADGVCDAMGLASSEVGRGELKSEEWFDRQLRKVNGVLKASNDLVMRIEGNFLVGNEFSVADIAIGADAGYAEYGGEAICLVKWKTSILS